MLLCKQICNRFILDFGVHNFVICLNYYKDVICIIIYVCNYEFSNIIVNCNLSFKSSRHMINNHFINKIICPCDSKSACNYICHFFYAQATMLSNQDGKKRQRSRFKHDS
jgi:hypothetical protein